MEVIVVTTTTIPPSGCETVCVALIVDFVTVIWVKLWLYTCYGHGCPGPV